MEDDVFKSEPRTFKMDRKCPQASKLKSSVHSKLFEFLGSYSDDVLAEYIVVLVCNGKHQNQAREDLDAFLGGESGAFVTWLWNHLSEDAENERRNILSRDVPKDVCLPRVPVGLSHLKESKSGNRCESSSISPKLISSNALEIKEDSQRWCTGSGTTLMEKSAEPDVVCDNGNEVVKYVSTQVRCSTRISAGGGEHSLQYEDKKIVNSNYITSPREFLQSAKREPVLRNLQSVASENPHSGTFSAKKAAGKRASVRAADYIVPSHSVKQRLSVWDRLGKSSEENGVMIGERISPRDIENTRRRKLEHNGGGIDKHKLMLVVPGGSLGKKIMGEIAVLDNSCSKVIPSTYTDEYRRLEQCAGTAGPVNDGKRAGRKRQFSEINSGNDVESLSDSRGKVRQDEVEFQELQFQRSSSIKSSDSQSLKRVSMSVNNSLPAKQEPPDHAESGTTNHRPIQAEVLDVKSRLLQIEMEMGRLRSKQVVMSGDAKLHTSSGSGAHSVLPEEDLDSRTIFVTNVHFAATKEALSSHFAKCGVVVKVIIGQPKGSAYIMFTSKEAVYKAISLDGTSFFSRILKVFRKGDAPAGISHPLPEQLTGKSPESFQKRKLCTQKSFQWRRDSSASANAGNPDVPPVPVPLPDSSSIVEQRAPNSGLQGIGRSLTYVRTERGPSTETPTQA